VITIAATDQDILRCFPVIRQLRPLLVQAEFVARIRRQCETGYRLALLEEEGEVLAVAGFRILENLSGGRVLYVDDLVTDEPRRSMGCGRRFLEWLTERARAEGCAKVDLDSGTHRTEAHRFYLANGMSIVAHHFRIDLG
jgi:GNAT superfamily N-acetyltransferase